MRKYPLVRLAAPAERNRASLILSALKSTAKRENWWSLAAAERAAYHTRTRPSSARRRRSVA
jgi:hypothetical protein